MNDFITSLIRTYVPIIVGALISYLAASGIVIDSTATLGLVTFLTGLSQAVYYLVARILEKKFPQFGFLLGSSKKPEYTETK